ncbi:MAG: hypothetical protein ABI612_10785, partial [Betaproteobacteria bacterium]
TAEHLMSIALAGDLGKLNSVVNSISETGSDSLHLRSTVGTLASTFGPTHDETGCGFKLRGARIRRVHCLSAEHEILDTDQGTLVRITLHGRATTVLLELSDGCSVLLPAIPDYLSELTFEDGELCHVGYEPTELSPRWHDYFRHRDEIRALRATIAATVGLGVVRLTSESALQIASSVQMSQSIDPSMALYAAYMYHDLGCRERIREMKTFLRKELGVTFFDIALLSADGSLRTTPTSAEVVPPVPLLSQGWSLLSAFRTPTSNILEHLRRHLRPSLWTLFDASATQTLGRVIARGEPIR